MIDAQADHDFSFPVRLLDANGPVIPDLGSVTFTVRDHNGQVMPGLTDIPVATSLTTFELKLPIPASANTLAAGKFFERRTVVVKMTRGGMPVMHRYPYRIVTFLNHAVTPQEVRSFIGVNSVELSDDEVDITSSYFTAAILVGASALEAALASGTQDEVNANEIIRMHAVLNVLPGLKQRLAQSEKNGVKEFARGKITDFDQLRNEAEARMRLAMEILVPQSAETYTLLVVTQDPDPVTGG